jgi:hypothetical protein
MTKEDKQLLLQDLCARLPYGVICDIYNDTCTIREKLLFAGISRFADDTICVRPYLRPMSSMTEEEKYELTKYAIIGDGHIAGVDFVDWIQRKDVPNYMDFLNSHYFDYRGLIGMGLAIEAPEGMYSN